MNEKTHCQNNQAIDTEEECCDLYAEYCYPCQAVETEKLNSEHKTVSSPHSGLGVRKADRPQS